MASDRPDAPPQAPPIPVTVLTGFLGSGKTTLLNALLRHPALADTAVVVNEFGEIGIDHLLVETAAEDMVLMKSGCVCCSVRGDLVDTLSDLYWRRDRGEISAFRRVVVETTGLADPGPILQTLMTDRALVERFRVGQVVTTVDCVHGAAQLLAHDEAVHQAALADRLVLTKADIAPAGAAAALELRLRDLNPLAPIVDRRSVDPVSLLSDDVIGDRTALTAGDDRDVHTRHGHAHDDEIRAYAVEYGPPLDWTRFRDWLDSLVSLRGAQILRIKGIVHARGIARPIAIQGVHHVFHPPELLETWPEGAPCTRLVIITRGVDLSRLRAMLETVNSLSFAPR